MSSSESNYCNGVLISSQLINDLFVYFGVIVATDAEQYEDKIKSQEYGKLKEMCLQEKTLFTDDLFAPAKYGAHFAKGKLAGKKIDWLRPGQFVSSPHFFLGTVDRFDVNQGKLSDCWLISAISDLTMRPKLFGKVVPNQSYTDDYAGYFI